MAQRRASRAERPQPVHVDALSRSRSGSLELRQLAAESHAGLGAVSAEPPVLLLHQRQLLTATPYTRHEKIRQRRSLGLLALSSACKEGLSAPSQDRVVAGSAQPIQNLVTGILATDRSQGSAYAYTLYPETMARNTAYVTTNEPRYVNELIGVPIDNTRLHRLVRMDRRDSRPCAHRTSC